MTTRLDHRRPAAGGVPEPVEIAGRDHERHIRPTENRVEPRTRDGSKNGRDHALTLPAGRDRKRVRHEGREYHLRGSDVDLLEWAGRLRVTFTEDLKRGLRRRRPFRRGSAVPPR